MPVIKGLECQKVILNGMVFWEPKFKKRRNRFPKPKGNMTLSDYKGAVSYSLESFQKMAHQQDNKWKYLMHLYHNDRAEYYRLQN